FLGTRLQCAECHNHPFDRWTQDDYYDWADLFARVKYKVIENKREISSDEHEWNGEQIVFVARQGSVKNLRTGKEAQPRFLGDPPADFRATNPASHPALLDALAEDFVKHKFDVRYLIGLIMNSRTYQLASEPNDTNAGDEVNFSRVLARRLGAEQLLDCQSQVTGVPLKFAGYPVGLRAAQLPGVRPESKGKRRATQWE